MLVVANVVASDGGGDWWSGVLVNGGTAIVLLVPLYYLTERLGQRIEGVRQEAAQSVGNLTERVETFEREVERRLDDAAEAVAHGLREERQRDALAIERLGEDFAREVVDEAIHRAFDLGLVGTRRGPRVPVSEDSDIYLRFEVERDEWAGRDDLFLILETDLGSLVDRLTWDDGDDATAVFVRLGRAVQRVDARADLDARWVMTRLRDTLAVALRDEAFRPILQLCPPQWCVTERGVTAYENGHSYTVTVDRIRELSSHVLSKPWVDGDSFQEAIMVAPYICPPVLSEDEAPF